MTNKFILLFLLLISFSAMADTPKLVITDEKKTEMKEKAKEHRKKFLEERKKRLESELKKINSVISDIDADTDK